MLIYFFIGMLPILFSFMLTVKLRINGKIEKNNIKAYIISIFIILLLISAFRNPIIGRDYPNYINRLLKGSWYVKSEPIMDIILRISNKIFFNKYWMFSLLTSALILSSVYYNLISNTRSNYIILSLLVYVLNPYMYIQSNFNIIRQALMASTLTFGIKYLINRQYLKYLFILFISFLIHNSSLVFIILIPWREIEWSRVKYYIITVILFLFNIFVKDLSIFSSIIKFFGYDGYIGSENMQYTKLNFLLYSIFILFVVFVIIKHYDTMFCNKKEKIYVDLYIISIILLFIFVKDDLVYRFYIILTTITLPAIEIIFRNVKTKFKKIYIIIFVLYYLVLYFSFLYSVRLNVSYIPFKFLQ